jgi:hypothetical protein
MEKSETKVGIFIAYKQVAHIFMKKRQNMSEAQKTYETMKGR